MCYLGYNMSHIYRRIQWSIFHQYIIIIKIYFHNCNISTHIKERMSYDLYPNRKGITMIKYIFYCSLYLIYRRLYIYIIHPKAYNLSYIMCNILSYTIKNEHKSLTNYLRTYPICKGWDETKLPLKSVIVGVKEHCLL